MQNGQNTPDGNRQPRLLATARARDAQLALIDTNLTHTEAERLEAILGQLIEVGALAFYSLGLPLEHASCWQHIVAFLREQVGAIPVDAVADATDYPATPTPKPNMLVPV